MEEYRDQYDRIRQQLTDKEARESAERARQAGANAAAANVAQPYWIVIVCVVVVLALLTSVACWQRRCRSSGISIRFDDANADGDPPAPPLPDPATRDEKSEGRASMQGPFSVADEIEKLATLRDKGHITDADFQHQKQRLLGK